MDFSNSWLEESQSGPTPTPQCTQPDAWPKVMEMMCEGERQEGLGT